MSEPQGNEQQAQQRHPPKKPPVIVRIFRYFERQRHRREGRETEHDRNERMTARWTRRLGIFTIILAAIGAFTAWILYETDQTSRTVQRAFVNISEMTSDCANPDVIDACEVKVFAENSGSTSTRDMDYMSLFQFNSDITFNHLERFGYPFASEDPEQIIIRSEQRNAKEPGHNKPLRAVLGPKQKIPIQKQVIRFNSLLPGSVGYTGPWFVYGMIRYHDIFEHTSLHTTKYCFAVRATHDVNGKNAITYDLCPHWNCADDECIKDKEDRDSEAEAAKKRLADTKPSRQ
jgi:hypothetical protein